MARLAPPPGPSLARPLRSLRRRLVVAALGMATTSVGAQENRSPIPSFAPEVTAAFFADAFGEALAAPPATASDSPQAPVPLPPGTPSPQVASPQVASTWPTRPWSQSVSSATLVDEVRRFVTAWQRAESKPMSDAQRARYVRHLATLYGVIATYDGEVRWKSVAGEVWRDLAYSLGSAEALSQVTADRMVELLRDNRWRPAAGHLAQTPGWEATPTVESLWRATLDRVTVMKRLEGSLQSLERRVEEPAGGQKLSARADQEAQITQLLAKLLQDPALPDATDAAYRAWCADLEEQARQFQRVQRDAPSDSAATLRQLRKACDGCHQDYRG